VTILNPLYSVDMPIPESLTEMITAPSTAGLWRLRGDLLASGVPPDRHSCLLIAAFHDYLNRLQTGTSSRDFSHLASKLDISAISGVILERLAEAGDSSEMAMGILSGALTEGLMVLATRQHVHAWEGELSAVHRDAAWFLYDQLWRWTVERSPDLAPEDRRLLLDGLFEPALAPAGSGLIKAVLLGRLFQILIVSAVCDDED